MDSDLIRKIINVRHYKTLYFKDYKWMMQHQPSMKQVMSIIAERDAAIQERNLAISERKSAVAERTWHSSSETQPSPSGTTP
ncbi:hypothetical protein Bca52824_096893 [Brassica carinata]|uniref:GAGA-binding transcriptional activator n=1 Tax=Brassica carinata TaxID=52824 RepID=A0A8X7TGL6_BRACI|nr:hypothetical protein Bca52824_096893 [Brassica carinata]